jgi:hypothetical protein
VTQSDPLHLTDCSRSSPEADPAAAMVDRVIFLDVDGVLHPLSLKGHPLNASLDDMIARSDTESAHANDTGQ